MYQSILQPIHYFRFQYYTLVVKVIVMPQSKFRESGG